MAASAVPLADADGVIHNIAADGQCIIFGIALYESGGSNAVAVLLKEGGSGGAVLATCSVAAGAAATTSFAEGVICRGDIYMDKVGTGTVAGTVHVK